MIFKMLLKNFAPKKKIKSTIVEPIEAIFQAFKIHACPGEPLIIKFKLSQNHILFHYFFEGTQFLEKML